MVGEFVESRRLGVVVTVAGEVGFLLRRSPDTLRGADVACLSREKLPLSLPFEVSAPGFRLGRAHPFWSPSPQTKPPNFQRFFSRQAPL